MDSLILILRKCKYWVEDTLLYQFLFVKTKIKQDGVLLDLNHKAISPKARVIINRGYERNEVSLIKEHLEAADSVLEIGAGIGFIGLYLEKVQKIQSYLGVEANTSLIPIIEHNAQLNNCTIQVLNYLVTNNESEYFENSEFYSSSQIRRTRSKRMIVPQISFEQLLLVSHFSPNTLILDIEGAEIELLTTDRLNKFQKIILETHPHIVGEKQTAKLITKIVTSGFQLVDFKENVHYYERIRR